MHPLLCAAISVLLQAGPTIQSISPRAISANVGYAPGIENGWKEINIVQVKGRGFRRGDLIVFGGRAERTRYVSSHILRARVPTYEAMDIVHQSSGGPPVIADIPVSVKRGKRVSKSLSIHFSSAVYGG